MLRINQIKIKVCPTEKKLELLNNKIKSIIRTDNYKLKRIIKESIDARDKEKLMYIFSVDIESNDEIKLLKHLKGNKNISQTQEVKYTFPYAPNGSIKLRPVIVGAGPAGYFCGLQLARAGYKPIIIERGKDVAARTIDVEKFWRLGTINKESNVSFGEGGAGTFSDGKLNTGIKDKNHRIEAVIEEFIKYGANENIAYINKPHIGTDVLKTILVNMREAIIENGGTILFNTKLTDIFIDNETISKISADITQNVEIDGMLKEIGNPYKCRYEGKNVYLDMETDTVVLAIGHSARDTFKRLSELRVPMEAKAFAMGLRIEHPAALINKSQYGTSKEAEFLPAASYKMTYRSSEGRSVYSFCMCPGGFVVNASSDINQSVVNGMSNSDRSEGNSNSAIVVNVTPEDFIAEGFGDKGVLAGMYMQEKYEKKAYEEGKSFIPVQLFKDYKGNVISTEFGHIKPNIKGNYSFANLNNCLPPYLKNAIIEGIEYYDSKLAGFADDEAVLSGIESRTSSPVRIIRNNENGMSDIKGLFPCGEGAGYAGGITSAAVDGIKSAEACAEYINSL